jgi:hypothetical protein
LKGKIMLIGNQEQVESNIWQPQQQPVDLAQYDRPAQHHNSHPYVAMGAGFLIGTLAAELKQQQPPAPGAPLPTWGPGGKSEKVLETILFTSIGLFVAWVIFCMIFTPFN